jgi:hypothetical protein
MKKWLLYILYISILIYGLFGLKAVYFKDWIELEAIATWVLAGSLFFVILQVYEARKSTNAQLAVNFYEFNTREIENILSKIYQSKPENVENEVPKEDIERVLDNMETLGILVKEGILDEKLAIRLFGGWPIRAWSRLSDYVELRRKERGHYSRYAEDFAKRSIKYQIQHDPKDEWTSLTIEGRKENLVEDLAKKLLSSRERGWSWFIRYLKHPRWLCHER